MATIFISLSAKQVGELYHYTGKPALLKILRSGKIALSAGRGMLVEHKHQSGRNYFASFTRSRFGGYHYHENGHTSVYDNTGVMITVDGNKLSQREKIEPIDYWEKRGSTLPSDNRNKEYEERLVSNRDEIPFLYAVKRVDFIQRGVHGETETYGFDKGKFSLKENERHQRQLGSIILQLKKHNIPYAFYDSMDDWARKRNPYTYIGPKDVETTTRNRGGLGGARSYQHLQALIEALSDKPYSQLSKAAQKIADQVYQYPSDIDAVFGEYENNRKPDATPALRKLALKLARAMQRKGFQSKQEAGKFIADKADAHHKAETKKLQDAESNEAAPLFVAALTKPIEEWPEHNKSWIAPRSVFLEIKDRFGYTYDEAVRTVNRVLQTDSHAVDKLRRTMHDMKLENAEDVVSYLWYNVVKPYHSQ